MKIGNKNYPGLFREDYGIGRMKFRIVINYNKQIIQEYFPFNLDPATEVRARKEALKRWRQLRMIYPVMTKRRFCEIPRIPSASGIVGVTRITTQVKGYEYEFWKATWTIVKGKSQSKQFSIKKYGVRKAKWLAIAARKEALDRLGPK